MGPSSYLQRIRLSKVSAAHCIMSNSESNRGHLSPFLSSHTFMSIPTVKLLNSLVKATISQRKEEKKIKRKYITSLSTLNYLTKVKNVKKNHLKRKENDFQLFELPDSHMRLSLFPQRCNNTLKLRQRWKDCVDIHSRNLKTDCWFYVFFTEEKYNSSTTEEESLPHCDNS